MGYGGRYRPPYHAVLALAAWADENWPLIDARCVLANVDPTDLPLRRLLNLAYALIVENVAFDPDRRREIDLSLDWPEEKARKSAEQAAREQDASARRTAKGLGVRNVDAFVERAWAQRQRDLEEFQKRQATALPEATT